MTDSATTRRAEVIEALAADLSRLRDSAGRPSFRLMAGRSGAISHTTLHEAAQGNRFPSWETTVEFVKACGADPRDYRERWVRASHVLKACCTARSAPAAKIVPAAAPDRSVVSMPNRRLTGAPDDRATGDGGAGNDDGFRKDDARGASAVGPPGDAAAVPAAVPTNTAPAAPHPTALTRRRNRPWRYAVLGGAVGLLVIGAGIAWSATLEDNPSPPEPQYGASDCPVEQTTPPSAPPANVGDHAQFVTDVTTPDCSRVHRGQTFTKVWRFRNAGSVKWTGYTLHRVDLPERRDQCQTITDVPIAATHPGQTVDVATVVTVPNNAGFCFVRFKMMDTSGHVAFPGGRPVNFQVVVD